MGTDNKKKNNEIKEKQKKQEKKPKKAKYQHLKKWQRVLLKALRILLIVLGVLVGILLLAALVLIIICLFNPTLANHVMSVLKALFMSEEDLLRERQAAIAKREEVVEDAGLYSDMLSHDLVPNYITVEQHGDILLGIITLEQALAENGYVATPVQKQSYKSGLLTREQYVYVIIGEKNFEKTLAENGYILSSDLKKALDEELISTEQFVKVLKGEISLDDALGMFVITEELNNALVEGRITREQYAEIIEGKLTLEKALEENSKPSGETPPDEESENNGEEITNDTPEDGEITEEQPQTPETGPEVPDVNTQPENKPPSSTDKTVVEDEASKALKSGKITAEQYTQIVLGEITLEQAISQNEDEKENETTANADVSDVQRRKAELINRMYVLRSNYISQIDGLVSLMKSEYSKLPAEQRTTSAKQSIASKYVSQIDSMERQCDAQVKAVVDELRQLLKSNGEDTSLADTIWQTYLSEKENTKAYYISTYGD